MVRSNHKWNAIRLCAELLLILNFALGTAGANMQQSQLYETTQCAAYASTRQITCIAVSPDGTAWVGTVGGILRRDVNGKWRKFTMVDGLPSNETRALVVDGKKVSAFFTGSSATWRDNRWIVEPIAQADANPATDALASVRWRGVVWTATATTLRSAAGGDWRDYPLPNSRGTHVSALLPHGEKLWAALYGDGLWSFDGRQWSRVDIGLPPEAREITALADYGANLLLGTRREGVWLYDGKSWTLHLESNEPYNHDIEFLATYLGRLFASTLEDGLATRSEGVWQHLPTPVVSSNAPRQMVEFNGALYVRHGNGKVDRLEGERWDTNVCAILPRKQVSALCADAGRLYAAQWGGWSEFDGSTWTHHLSIPELQGVSITALCRYGDALWIGTQGRGIGEWKEGKLIWHDARNGLPDDWTTCLLVVNGKLYAGTFVGGLAVWEGESWRAFESLKGENVTDLASDDAGGLYIATRTSLFHQLAGGEMRRDCLVANEPYREVQALHKDADGLWVGTRTGLYCIPNPTLK